MVKIIKCLIIVLSSRLPIANCQDTVSPAGPVDLSAITFDLQGDLSAHDPVLIRQQDTWYLFYTGYGIKIKTSPDGVTWKDRGQVFGASLT